MKILLIEKEPVLRLTFSYLLEDDGHAVTSTGNATEAYATVQSWEPDLVVTEPNMRDRDGRYHLMIQELRQIDDRIPIIAMSGSLDPGEMERALADGATVYFKKPVDGVTLMHAVRALTPRG